MYKLPTAKALWTFILFLLNGLSLKILCHGSTFSPVLSPLGDNVYITDRPTLSKLGVTLAGCATQCRFYSALNGGSSECRCFNYDSTRGNCSVFAFPPTAVATDLTNPTAYQTSDGLVTALFDTVSRRRCLFPFDRNGQKSYDCLSSNSPNSVGRFGCVLPNKKQVFCNPQFGRGLFLTSIITSPLRFTAVTQYNDELFVLRTDSSTGSLMCQVTVYNATTFQSTRPPKTLFQGNCYGIAHDRTNSRIFVGDFDHYKLHALDWSTLQDISGSPWQLPSNIHALSMNSVNNVLVSLRNGDIYEYTSTGALVRTISTGTGSTNGVVQAVEVSNGMLVISFHSANDVRLITVDGTVLQSYGVGKVNSPRGLAVDKKGFVLVADYGNNRILALDPTLTKSGSVTFPLDTTNQLNGPFGLWYDESRSRLYVGELNAPSRVLVFDNVPSISDILQQP